MDPRHIRVGDTERSLCVEMLNHAFGQGMLTFAEFDERSAAAAAATTRGDLDELIADLPLGQHPTGPQPATAGSRAGAMAIVPGNEALRFSGPPPSTSGMRFFTTHKQEGRWSVGERLDAQAVCSTLVYDFTTVERTSRIVNVDCKLVMTELTLLVEPGTLIVNEGVNLMMSSINNKLREATAPTYQSAPLIIQLSGFLAMSSVMVKEPRAKRRLWG